MEKSKRYEIDMCNGSILKKMLLFALPLMCSSMLQLLFNAADIVVVGRFAGDNSLAAVGSTSSLINLLTNLFVGLSVGANVLVAQYYGAKKEMADADLTAAELQEHNGYNTRSTELYGKLPIGPICNPSMSAIEAAINPDINNYYYFVSDKNKKIYFNTTSAGHNQTISSLKNEGLWYTY